MKKHEVTAEAGNNSFSAIAAQYGISLDDLKNVNYHSGGESGGYKYPERTPSWYLNEGDVLWIPVLDEGGGEPAGQSLPQDTTPRSNAELLECFYDDGGTVDVNGNVSCAKCEVHQLSFKCLHGIKNHVINLPADSVELIELVADQKEGDYVYDVIELSSADADACNRGNAYTCPSYEYGDRESSKKINIGESVKIYAPVLFSDGLSWRNCLENLLNPIGKYNIASIDALTCSSSGGATVIVKVYPKVKYGGTFSVSYNGDKFYTGKRGRPQEGYWQIEHEFFYEYGSAKYKLGVGDIPTKIKTARDTLDNIFDTVGPLIGIASKEKNSKSTDFKLVWPNFEITGEIGNKEEDYKVVPYGRLTFAANPFLGISYQVNLLPLLINGVVYAALGPVAVGVEPFVNKIYSYVSKEEAALRLILYFKVTGAIDTGKENVYLDVSSSGQMELAGQFGASIKFEVTGEATVDIEWWIVSLDAGVKASLETKLGIFTEVKMGANGLDFKAVDTYLDKGNLCGRLI